MKKRILTIGLSLAMLLCLAACSSGAPGNGTKDGKIGTAMKTYFFDFTVESAAIVERSDYTPEDGNVLLDMVITTTNTQDEAIEMYDYDYQLQWGERGDNGNFSIVLDALDDEGAPLSYMLAPGESMTYHYLFEVPADVKDFEICYLEEYTDQNGEEGTGDIHYVSFSV